MLMRKLSSSTLMIRTLKKNCVHVNISLWFLNLNGRDTRLSVHIEELNATLVDQKLEHFFNNLRCAAEMNLAFNFTFISLEDGKSRSPAGSIQTCVHHGGLDKAGSILQKIDVTESVV